MRWWLLGVVTSILGCGGGDAMPAVRPGPYAPAGTHAVHLHGTVERIRFQNINKAQGHYTYNVELHVRHDGLPEANFESLHGPGVLSVRIAKVYWSSLEQAEQHRLAPEGPQSVMDLEAWDAYEVGASTDLRIAPTSADLAFLAPPASP